MNSKKLLLTILIIMFLFSGMDRYSIDIGAGNLRLIFFIMPIMFFIFLYKKLTFNKLFKVETLLLTFFISASAISIFYSQNQLHSLMYWFWAILTVLLFYLVYITSIELGSKKLQYILIYVNFIVSILVVLLSIIGNLTKLNIMEFVGLYKVDVYRPFLWFYEPSYLVTFLIFFFVYFSFCYFFGEQKRTYLFSSLINLLALLLATSSTGYIGIGITIISSLFWILYLKKSSKSLKVILYISLIICVCFVIFSFFEEIYNAYFVRIFKDFEGSTGNRIELYDQGIEVFKSSPFFGVGIGGYSSFVGNDPTNTFIEIFATLGLLGGIPLVLFFIFPIFRGWIKSIRINKVVNYKLFSAANAVLITLIILQANQNYLRPYVWIEYAILLAFVVLNSKEKKLEK